MNLIKIKSFTQVTIKINKKYCENERILGCCNFLFGTIILKEHPNTNIPNFLCYLHELGHRHYKHTPFDSKSPHQMELEAWEYAKSCMKPKYHYLINKYFTY